MNDKINIYFAYENEYFVYLIGVSKNSTGFELKCNIEKNNQFGKKLRDNKYYLFYDCQILKDDMTIKQFNEKYNYKPIENLSTIIIKFNK